MERFTEFDSYAKGTVQRWDEVSEAWHASYKIGMPPDKRMLLAGFLNVLQWLDDVAEFAGMLKAAREALTSLERGGKRPRSEAQNAALAKAHEALRAKAAAAKAAGKKQPMSDAQKAALAKAHAAVRAKGANGEPVR